MELLDVAATGVGSLPLQSGLQTGAAPVELSAKLAAASSSAAAASAPLLETAPTPETSQTQTPKPSTLKSAISTSKPTGPTTKLAILGQAKPETLGQTKPATPGQTKPATPGQTLKSATPGQGPKIITVTKASVGVPRSDLSYKTIPGSKAGSPKIIKVFKNLPDAASKSSGKTPIIVSKSNVDKLRPKVETAKSSSSSLGTPKVALTATSAAPSPTTPVSTPKAAAAAFEVDDVAMMSPEHSDAGNRNIFKPKLCSGLTSEFIVSKAFSMKFFTYLIVSGFFVAHTSNSKKYCFKLNINAIYQ